MIRMSVTINTRGLTQYRNNLALLEQVVSATAANIEGEAKQSILARQSQGNPRIEGGRIHYAAEPGNPPNSDTGNLANSIGHRMTGRTSAEVFSNAEYSIPLEIGFIARNGVYQGPWPFMVPAVERHAGPFRQAVASVMRGRRP